MTTVDARGLSCPQPVLLSLREMKKLGTGKIEILVDTDTSRENVGRAATSQGWAIAGVQTEAGGYRIVIRKE
jgi:TusA-related sulfurtransferase